MQSSCQVVVRWPWGLGLKAHSSPLSGHLGQVPPTSVTCLLVALYGSGRPWVCFCLWYLCPGPILHPTFCWWPSAPPPRSQMSLVPCWSRFCWSSATFVDRLSKAVHLVSLSGFPSVKRMAKLFLEHVIWLHGFPKDIVFDRGPQFTIGGPNQVAFWHLLGPLPVLHWTLVVRAEGFSIWWLGWVWPWGAFMGAVLLYLGLLSHLRFPPPSTWMVRRRSGDRRAWA